MDKQTKSTLDYHLMNYNEYVNFLCYQLVEAENDIRFRSVGLDWKERGMLVSQIILLRQELRRLGEY